MLPPIHNPARSQPCGRCAPKSLYLLGSGVIRQQRPDSTGETWYDLGTASDRSAWMSDIPSWHMGGIAIDPVDPSNLRRDQQPRRIPVLGGGDAAVGRPVQVDGW